MRWVTKILLRKFILEKPENLLENSWKSPGILNLYLAGHPVIVSWNLCYLQKCVQCALKKFKIYGNITEQFIVSKHKYSNFKMFYKT